MSVSLSRKDYDFILAEINDTHEVLDRHGVPRRHLGEKLSLAQRARILEERLTASRIAAVAVRKDEKLSRAQAREAEREERARVEGHLPKKPVWWKDIY